MQQKVKARSSQVRHLFCGTSPESRRQADRYQPRTGETSACACILSPSRAGKKQQQIVARPQRSSPDNQITSLLLGLSLSWSNFAQR